MNVLFTTQVYPPEAHPSAIMVEQFARYLLARGHQVVVAAGYPHHPHGRLLGGYRRQPWLDETKDGIRVIRGWHLLSESRRISGRAVVMASQALAIGCAALGADRADVIISYGPPLVGPILSSVAARRFHAGLITVVYDIYPDVVIRNGKIASPLAIAGANALEAFAYRVSDRLLVLSDGFKRQLQDKGVAADKIAVVPVWLDADEVRPGPRVNAWRNEQGISPATKVVLYAGTIGIVSGAMLMLRVAERFAARDDVLFLFVGEGQAKEDLQRAATDQRLANVRFLPLQPRERLAEVQATSDVSVVTLSPGNGYMSVPSKVIGYLAAGRPVVASVDLDCDTAECVRSAGCGAVVSPGDPAALALAIDRLLADSDLREAQGQAARRAFEAQHASQVVLARYEQVLQDVASEVGP